MSSNKPQFKQIVCGGTFDLLHKGHKSFLSKILELTDNLILGLTSDKFASQKEGEHESYEARKQNVEKFVSTFNKRVEIVPIDDMFGPLISDDLSPDAIALTEETKSSLDSINKKRSELGLVSLKPIIIPMEKAEDGKIISSTRIRRGEINRDGRLYLSPNWKGKMLVLPDDLREELHRPFGPILNSPPDDIDPSKTIVVGDVSSKLFNEKKINPSLSIIDFRVHRQKKFDRLEQLGFDPTAITKEVKNDASTIAPELFSAIKQAMDSKNQTVILVDGEEDLAVVPCLLISPLGFSIYYGQPARIASQSVAGGPDQGLVEVRVTEESKEKAYGLAERFASN